MQALHRNAVPPGEYKAAADKLRKEKDLVQSEAPKIQGRGITESSGRAHRSLKGGLGGGAGGWGWGVGLGGERNDLSMVLYLGICFSCLGVPGYSKVSGWLPFSLLGKDGFSPPAT